MRGMRILAATIIGGAIAGALDITYAVLFNLTFAIPPIRILQSIASGLLGRAAYAGGIQTATLGLALHMGMATMMAAAFVAVAAFLPVLRRHALLIGIFYGLLLFLIMNCVVAPLSAIGPGRFPEGVRLVGALLAHALLVGVPIAYCAKVFLEPRSNARQV
jgi:uncharacterized membrane protein YagU involved in acid resistance